MSQFNCLQMLFRLNFALRRLLITFLVTAIIAWSLLPGTALARTAPPKPTETSPNITEETSALLPSQFSRI